MLASPLSLGDRDLHEGRTPACTPCMESPVPGRVPGLEWWPDTGQGRAGAAVPYHSTPSVSSGLGARNTGCLELSTWKRGRTQSLFSPDFTPAHSLAGRWPLPSGPCAPVALTPAVCGYLSREGVGASLRTRLSGTKLKRERFSFPKGSRPTDAVQIRRRSKPHVWDSSLGSAKP